MRNKWHSVLVCSLFLLMGMRDPFQPPVDSCASGQLAQWRYQGWVSGVERVAILQDEKHRWRRIRQGERLPAGWRVLSVNETELVVEVGNGCEPKEWRWQREGSKHDESKDSRPADDTQQRRVGQPAKTGHAGRG